MRGPLGAWAGRNPEVKVPSERALEDDRTPRAARWEGGHTEMKRSAAGCLSPPVAALANRLRRQEMATGCQRPALVISD
jgi:hypothetical protein